MTLVGVSECTLPLPFPSDSEIIKNKSRGYLTHHVSITSSVILAVNVVVMSSIPSDKQVLLSLASETASIILQVVTDSRSLLTLAISSVSLKKLETLS